LGGIPKDRRSRHARRDLLEQLQPFPADAVFENHETREISDDELDNVTAGRKAGGDQQESFTVSSPPTPIETVVGWIRGLFK
jgi:hypothetical protein